MRWIARYRIASSVATLVLRGIGEYDYIPMRRGVDRACRRDAQGVSMKKQPRIFCWTLILLATTVLQAADAPSGSDFRIEVLVHKSAPGPKSIPVRCISGCAWNAQTIECPAASNECRVIVDARAGIEPAIADAGDSDQVRPVSETVCLGVGTGPPRQADASSGTPAGIVIMGVVAGSPAELAGFAAGDLLTDLNSVPTKHGMDLRAAIPKLAAGDVFDATVYRKEAPVSLRGRLGVMTTADRCMPADPELLARPAVMAPKASKAPFMLAFDDLGEADLRCLSGCLWRTSAPCQANFSCSFQIDQDGNAEGSGAELKDGASNFLREQVEQSAARLDLSGLRPLGLMGVGDCSSDFALHGAPTDQPVDLDPTLRARLMKQMGAQNIQGQPCWYKTTGGEVFAHTHSSCGAPVEFHFQNIASGWTLSRIEIRGSCPQGR